MARTTKAERKRRREAALAKISDGHGFADTAARALDRRQSAHDAGLCMVALVSASGRHFLSAGHGFSVYGNELVLKIRK